MLLTLILLLSFVFILVWHFLKKHYAYWERKSVPGPKPSFISGNMGEMIMMKKSLFEICGNIYKEYKHLPFVGIFRGTVPVLLVCDPELIKDFTIKSFSHFHDNDVEVDKNVDPIFGRNPFCLKGEEWKFVRSQLTPGFTSGKMKLIYPLLEESAQKMIKFIEREETCTNGRGCEAKELCSKFTLNNVASCAFGIEAKAFEDEDSEFKYIAKNFFESGVSNFAFFIGFLIPIVTKLISIKFIKKEIEDKLTNMVSQTLKYREENNVIRNDFLDILNNLKRTCKDYEFTDVDVTAHASGFFLDGYETSATVMSFVLYDLASNPAKQTKLREELEEHFRENEDKLSYEILQKLPYLEAVFSESLRMHAPIFALGKICTKPYTYIPKAGDGINKPVTIEKGTPVAIPLFGLHYDPQYFENPDIFNPERFLGTNKEKIVKFTYMPFGEGPRACLGQRFGILQVKVGIAHIINNFEIGVNSKTKLPLEYDPFAFITTPKGGLWIDFKRILT